MTNALDGDVLHRIFAYHGDWTADPNNTRTDMWYCYSLVFLNIETEILCGEWSYA